MPSQDAKHSQERLRQACQPCGGTAVALEAAKPQARGRAANAGLFWGPTTHSPHHLRPLFLGLAFDHTSAHQYP